MHSQGEIFTTNPHDPRQNTSSLDYVNHSQANGSAPLGMTELAWMIELVTMAVAVGMGMKLA